MKILARVLALFLIMPVVELFLLLQFEQWADQWTGGYGLIATLGLILFTGLIGGYLAKREGLAVWHRLKRQLERGGLPGTELMDGAIILVSGGLLMAPGVLSDLVGLMGLFPPTRALSRKIALRLLNKAAAEGALHASFGLGGPEWDDAAWDEPGWNDASEWEAAWDSAPAPNAPSDADAATWQGAGRTLPHERSRPFDGDDEPRHGSATA